MRLGFFVNIAIMAFIGGSLNGFFQESAKSLCGDHVVLAYGKKMVLTMLLNELDQRHV